MKRPALVSAIDQASSRTLPHGPSALLAMEGIEVRIAPSADVAIGAIAAFDPEALRKIM